MSCPKRRTLNSIRLDDSPLQLQINEHGDVDECADNGSEYPSLAPRGACPAHIDDGDRREQILRADVGLDGVDASNEDEFAESCEE